MRERGRERVRGGRDGHRSRAGRTTLGREHAGSRGRSQQWRFQQTGQRQTGQRQKGEDQFQYRSRQKGDSYDWGLYKQATAYFFTNFPEDWSYEEMWRTFKNYGRVYAIYSPNRKNRNGKRFGFVRFLDVKDMRELERNLDQIWIGGRKLWVNLPRYEEGKMENVGGRFRKIAEPTIQNRSYAEVVKGQPMKNQKEEGRTQGRKQEEKRSERNINRECSKQRNEEARTIWQQKGMGKSWAGFEYNPKPEDYSWLEGSFVGLAHSVEMVRNLQEKFYMEGYFSCRIRAMGGRMVLLDCEDKEELKDLVELAADWLGQWFEVVRPWTPEMVAKERFVWIRGQGVPLNAWNTEFFEKMGCSWGKFICLDDSTSKRRRFDIARFLISTQIMDTIKVSRQVKINGSMYNLKFSEEETTNCFFSLKQDFLPSFHSEEEEDESWSIGSEMETPECVNAEGEAFCHEKYSHEEDDDVAWEGKRKEQLSKEEEKVGETPAGSSSQFQIQIQNLNGNKDRATDICPEKEKEVREPVSQAGIVDGTQMGFKNKPSSNSFKEPNAQEARVENQESTNMGLAQDRGENKWADPSYNKDRSGNRDLSEVESEEEGEDVFWRGYEKDQGRVEEWISKQIKKTAKGKRRKARSCSSVYRCTMEVGTGSTRKIDGKKQSMQRTAERKTPDFLPNPDGKVAGGSVGDSGILNCNRSIKKQLQSQLAMEIWDLAKQLGASLENDADVLQKIEEMEKRDSRRKGDKANPSTRGAKKIREMVMKENVDFIAIQETKLVMVDRKICRTLWGTEDFDWVAKPSVGRSGGLLCIWNDKVLKKLEVIEGNNFIGISGLWGDERIPVYLLNIYSPCQLMGKRFLWDDLQNLMNSRRGNWCLVGDFNAVRGIEERAGGSGINAEMREFDNFINNAALIDLPLLGRKYTWYNSNGQYMSRIDRFLLSEDWVSRWGDVKQWGLRRSVSDHCPILLKNEKIDWGPKPFKFFDAWFEKPGCRELIRSVWKFNEIQGKKGFILKEKLKRTKKALKEWSRNLTEEVDDKVKKAESVIAEIDEKGESSQLTAEDVERRRGSFIDLWKNLRIKERMWQQKAKRMWFKEGDANTRFFHTCVKGRWRRNEINCIRINGELYTGVKEIKEEVAKYFKDLFSEEAWQRPRLDGIRVNQISQAENEMLGAVFEEKEIKEAIWDCCSSKSPGPDGFNFGFVKKMWEDIKVEVIDFVQEFWDQGRLARGSNASFIVLIPKKDNPQGIEDYRPISLIGIMYKIIAKLLANRLRKVLPKVIGEQQMAFIEGRQLIDGVVIANEVIDEVKRKRKNSFLFKVDFEKAYDRVSWSFIDYMMMRMGFSEKWRKWIQECLRSSSVSVLINGSPTKEFPVSKGIRQGDPLSPFLFLIVAEGLNGLVSAAVEKNLYKGVMVGSGGTTITHLQFADDTIFFGEASDENIKVVKGIMRTFELASGLKINFAKSQLIGMGVEENWTARMAYRLCCSQGEFPLKYLGIPIGGNHRKTEMWYPMIQSFKKKLASWKGRHLSLGGRITLINSVLSSLPVFLMSVFLIPKGILLSIDKIRKSFLWGGGGDERKVNWVKWEKICKKKEEGGLGVRDLRKFNLALMGKWWGRLAENKEGNGTWTWNLNWRRNLYEWEVEEAEELQKRIESVRVTDGDPDRWEWIHDKGGQYSTKSAYALLSRERVDLKEEKTYKRIWNPILPSKISAFNWQLVLDKIPTKANLVRRGIIKDVAESKCALCNEEEEDATHLFLKCKIARWIWKACSKWWGSKMMVNSDCWNTFQLLGRNSKGSKIREGMDSIWKTAVWSIWIARNQKIFHSKEVNPNTLLELIQMRSFWWIKARKDWATITFSDWVIDPAACFKT
ncbi:hypothetical protein SLEP1_g49342 [Rubroshorea leprosula]|uniref:Uncharacterized protein n=1 Tax=Rubroshorea leprosula TaxID=152421 RepID=A0AAV5LZS1_9ROSI|nr:hypothetical protein SLEP1_g49342 [Rubroshorea leprosula]